jgi:protein phosphatase
MIATRLSYQFCAQTDQGRVRGNNEDAYVFDDLTGLAVLADGMGGYNAGEVASQMACAGIRREMLHWFHSDGSGEEITPDDIAKALARSVAQANADVLKAARGNSAYTGMGTTLVAGVFHGQELVLGHVGDSRCYRLRGDEFTQITKDHSLLQEQIDAGLVTPEQAATATYRNLVTRAVGVDAAVMLEVHEHLVEPNDLYLICSDGLSDMVSDAEMAKILQSPSSQSGGLEQRAKALIDKANERGGRDNITVVLAQAHELRREQGAAGLGTGAGGGRNKALLSPLTRWLSH